MRGIVIRGAIGVLILVLAACSSSLENGLDAIPQVHITESARTALTAGAVGGSGITLTDESSGASVSIPAGAVITLDASAGDDVPAVLPESIVLVLRPISQFLASQDGDLLTADGLNLPKLSKVGALAVLPVIGKTNTLYTVTIPVVSTATGDLSIWHFEPDDNPNSDGVLVALPTIGHWRFLDTATATAGKVTFTTDTFGQFLVTTLADTGGGGTAPTVDLTADVTSGDAPLAVVFTANATDDGTITKYEWDFNGDGTFDTETTTNTANNSYAADGQYEAKVQVTDDEGEIASDTLTISVGNVAPVIGALNPLVATTGEPTVLTVTATDDGTIDMYEWDLDNDGTDFEIDSGTTNSTTATFDTAGTSTIGVRVTDDEGLATTETFDIVVSDPPGPSATLTAAPSTGVLSDTNELPVDFTTLLNPDTTTFDTVVYDFGDGTAPVTETDTPLTAQHTYTTADTFTATVTVTPTGGGADIVASTEVTVLPTGTVLAELTADPDEGTLSGGELAVDFTTELTPDTTTFDSVVYDFGDGSAPVTELDTPLTATHTYTAADTYDVTVTVTPTGGGTPVTDTTTVIVNAESGANQAPTAVISSVPVAGNTRAFNLDASGSTDPENDTLTFAWEWDSSNAVPESTDESATATFPDTADGTPQTITLTVTDSAGNTDTEEKVVVPTAP